MRLTDERDCAMMSEISGRFTLHATIGEQLRRYRRSEIPELGRAEVLFHGNLPSRDTQLAFSKKNVEAVLKTSRGLLSVLGKPPSREAVSVIPPKPGPQSLSGYVTPTQYRNARERKQIRSICLSFLASLN
jgi:hypothetical protein